MAHQLADRLKPHVSARSRKRIVRARFASRAPTAAARVLPDFLVIGAMRSATSSLYKYLSQHPEVAPSLRKEVEYFTRDYRRGERWYRQHFALAARRRIARARGRQLLAFEATPYYLYAPRCPSRAHQLLPDARLVVLLRDPVERAYSDYQHMRRYGFESLSFAEALAAEEGRLAPELARMAEDEDYFSKVHHRFSYFSRGRYAEQLERWLELYPRSQLLVLESKQLQEDPRSAVGQIVDFLGLRPWAPQVFRNYSYVGAPPVRSRLDDGLRRELRARYAPDDERLTRLLGTAPSWTVEP